MVTDGFQYVVADKNEVFYLSLGRVIGNALALRRTGLC